MMVDINNFENAAFQRIRTPVDGTPYELDTGFRLIREEITNVGSSLHQCLSDFLTSVTTPASQPAITSVVKQEKDSFDILEVDSDHKFYGVQNNFNVRNGQRSADIESEDTFDKEINDKIANFIELLMTKRQPDDHLRSLYNDTHRPANVPALGEVEFRSAVKTEELDLGDRMEYAQNCMLKGVTKTAYVMDTLFKHVDKLPKELQPEQLMSDINSAMRFFGAANLELSRIRKETLVPDSISRKPFKAKMESDNMPSPRLTGSRFQTRRSGSGSGGGGSRYHPYSNWEFVNRNSTCVQGSN